MSEQEREFPWAGFVKFIKRARAESKLNDFVIVFWIVSRVMEKQSKTGQFAKNSRSQNPLNSNWFRKSPRCFWKFRVNCSDQLGCRGGAVKRGTNYFACPETKGKRISLELWSLN